MAVDKQQTRELLDQIDGMFNAELVSLPIPISPNVKQKVRDMVFGQALGEIRRMIEEARPPVFYLLGRSQHGKSSLVNAMAGRTVASVGGSGIPTTSVATRYRIEFPERYAEWDVIDSRGLFEVTPTAKGNATEAAIRDVLQHSPDILLHVISILEVANLENDISAMARIQEAVRKQKGAYVPALVVLTRTDSLNPVSHWPPDKHDVPLPEMFAALAV